MPLLATSLTDIYEPKIWSQYFTQNIVDKSLLIQSGIADNSADIQSAAESGGTVIELPFFNDLPNGVDANTKSKVVNDTDTEITPTGVKSSKDVARKLFRSQSWQVSNLVKYVAGSDPAQVVLDRFTNWWVRETQRIALLQLSGLFDKTNGVLKDTHLVKNYIEDGNSATASNLINDDIIQDARFVLGDNFTNLTAIIMHSTVYKRLEKLDLITTVPPSNQLSAPIPYYHGLRVLIDDTITVRPGATSGYVYDTYLFGQGALAYATVPISEPNVELYYNPKAGVGAGSTDIITRNYFIMHPRGIAYTGSITGSTPTDTELSTANNWTKVYDDKLIRVACIRTNG